MKTIKENWKVMLIVAAGVVAVILLCVCLECKALRTKLSLLKSR